MERSGLDGSGDVIPITNVTAIINEAHYKDAARLVRVLQSHRSEQTGRWCFVTGTWDQIDDLSVQLSAAVKREAAPGSSSRVSSVSVSASVVNFIQHKCPGELQRIAGSRFVLEIQPEVRRAAREGGGMVLVTFRPRTPSESRLRADLVRQRFVVFYQKTASDLTVANLPVSFSDISELRRSFPRLLFERGGDGPELTVTGAFPHVAAFRTSLLQKPSSGRDLTTFGASSASRPGHEEESCPICLENIDAAKKTSLACKHSFCTDCLRRAFEHKPVCPTCGKVYGVLRGTQPEGGKMAVSRSHSSLPGHEQHGTIVIDYSIPSGIQQAEHPNPGEPYSGASRRAFLPDSSEGRRVLMLLRKAFEQRLIFTVGQSTSTSRTNTVTWNDVHHKTSVHGGPTHYGYPDPDYLRRVEEELAAKGLR